MLRSRYGSSCWSCFAMQAGCCSGCWSGCCLACSRCGGSCWWCFFGDAGRELLWMLVRVLLVMLAGSDGCRHWATESGLVSVLFGVMLQVWWLLVAFVWLAGSCCACWSGCCCHLPCYLGLCWCMFFKRTGELPRSARGCALDTSPVSSAKAPPRKCRSGVPVPRLRTTRCASELLG